MLTVTYTNKQEGCETPNFNNAARRIFKWAIVRTIRLVALHVPEKLYVKADLLSRNFCHETDWMLNPFVFACPPRSYSLKPF